MSPARVMRTRPHDLRHTAITVAVERAAELGRPLMTASCGRRSSPAGSPCLLWRRLNLARKTDAWPALRFKS